MAYIGLAYPIIAPLVSQATSEGVTTPTYGTGFKCGKATSVNITPNYSEASLHADNILDEYVKDFRDGDISLGVDRIPAEHSNTLFGHTYSSSDKETTYSASDAAGYVGVGFYVTKIEDGKRSYEASILFKCAFAEAANSFTTKGDSIEFDTPTLEGKVASLDDGVWKKTRVFDTEAAAQGWLQTTLNYSPAA